MRTLSPKTLSYLASPQVYFGYIDEVEHDLTRFRNQPNKQADYFIEKYVASHSFLFDRLPKIASIALDVLEIRDRVFGNLTTVTRKKIALQPSLREDTDFNLKNVKSFIIHFLTNPRVSTVLVESGHRTTPERVFAVNEIIYQLRQQHPAEADGTLLSIVYRLFGQHEERFKSTFAQLGLPVDLTWEYVQGIVMDRIKLLPDPFYTASKTKPDSLISVNVIYYVDPHFEAENVEHKPASTSRVDDFIELFVHKGIFRKKDFIQLSEPEREKVFTAVFESGKLTTPAAHRKAIERTLIAFKIQYLPDKKRFGSKYEEQAVRPDEWLLNAQVQFVNLWLQQVKKGKAEVLNATDEIVLKRVIGPFLKNQVKKLPQTIRGFDSVVFRLNAQVGTGALSYTDAFTRLVHVTAAYILQMWLSDDNREEYSLTEIKTKIYDSIRQNFTKDRLLSDRTQEHTFHSVTSRKIDSLIRLLQIQYYPRKQIYLESVSEMLGQSLSAIKELRK